MGDSDGKTPKIRKNRFHEVMQLTKIKIEPCYGNRVAVLPVPPDDAVFREATREQLAVLIALMSGTEFSYFTLAEKCGATREQIDGAVRYWENAGILTVHRTEQEAERPSEPVQKSASKALERASQLPHYNTDEAARYLEQNPTAASLIDCCQQELGKIFNTAEAEIIIGLLDYLSLGPEYILFLCAYLGKKGRKSLRYIEKTAISLHDAGVVTYEQLELHLKKLDMTESAEKKLRDLFGIGERALVKRERDAFFRWIAEWEMPLEVIERAYEITVTRTKEPSVPYTNAILEKWNAEGIRTVEQVEEAEAARKSTSSVVPGSSFETEDFFDLALKRSYGDKK